MSPIHILLQPAVGYFSMFWASADSTIRNLHKSLLLCPCPPLPHRAIKRSIVNCLVKSQSMCITDSTLRKPARKGNEITSFQLVLSISPLPSCTSSLIVQFRNILQLHSDSATPRVKHILTTILCHSGEIGIRDRKSLVHRTVTLS